MAKYKRIDTGEIYDYPDSIKPDNKIFEPATETSQEALGSPNEPDKVKSVEVPVKRATGTSGKGSKKGGKPADSVVADGSVAEVL
jgi:hypothetical protein